MARLQRLREAGAAMQALADQRRPRGVAANSLDRGDLPLVLERRRVRRRRLPRLPVDHRIQELEEAARGPRPALFRDNLAGQGAAAAVCW